MIYIIGMVISFFIITPAWIKWIARINHRGIERISDIGFGVFESLMFSMAWPITLPIAILYLGDFQRPANRKLSSLYAFINYIFRDEDK